MNIQLDDAMVRLPETPLLTVIWDLAGITRRAGMEVLRGLSELTPARLARAFERVQTSRTRTGDPLPLLPGPLPVPAAGLEEAGSTSGQVRVLAPSLEPALTSRAAESPESRAPQGLRRPRLKANVRPLVRRPERSGVFLEGIEQDWAKESGR
jgi:hypothetical protein